MIFRVFTTPVIAVGNGYIATFIVIMGKAGLFWKVPNKILTPPTPHEGPRALEGFRIRAASCNLEVQLTDVDDDSHLA